MCSACSLTEECRNDDDACACCGSDLVIAMRTWYPPCIVQNIRIAAVLAVPGGRLREVMVRSKSRQAPVRRVYSRPRFIYVKTSEKYVRVCGSTSDRTASMQAAFISHVHIRNDKIYDTVDTLCLVLSMGFF